MTDGIVEYRFFDKDFQESSHTYIKKPQEECKRNCHAVTKAMSASGIVVMCQVHEADVLYVDSPTLYGSEPEVDAVVTDKPGLILGVQTADCVPVLFACNTGKIVAAAHAGWKSAKAGIVANVVKLMKDMGAHKIVAIIGPAIQQQSYEVGQEFYKSFMIDDASNNQFFTSAPQKDKMLFNLPRYVYHRLNQSNVVDITQSTEDTYSNPDKYHSYRKSCHDGVVRKGNILSAIMIK